MGSIKKAVVTAAGNGTRQYPITNTVQKELIPIVDVDGYTKPTLQIILEEAVASGIEELCIIANPTNAEPIRAHFRGLTLHEKEHQFRGKDWAFALSDALEDLQKRITIVIQHTQEGYGHAVHQAKQWVGDDPFMLMLGDHLTIAKNEKCTTQIMNLFEQTGCPVTSVARIREPYMTKYGTAAGSRADLKGPASYWMTGMAEKPTVEYAREHLKTAGLQENEYLCFYGCHAFPASVFECLDYLIDNDIRQNGEVQMAAAQQLLFERGGKYLLAEIEGEMYDMGTPDGLIQTQTAFALNSKYSNQVYELVKNYS